MTLHTGTLTGLDHICANQVAHQEACARETHAVLRTPFAVFVKATRGASSNHTCTVRLKPSEERNPSYCPLRVMKSVKTRM